jgi:hypothetical protein
MDKLREILLVNFRGKALSGSTEFTNRLLYHADGKMSNIFKIPFSRIKDEYYGKGYNTTRKSINRLLELGIIECDEQYIPKNQPLGYRISNDYLPIEKQSTTILTKYKEREMDIKTIIEEDDFFAAPPGPEGYELLTGNIITDVIEEESVPIPDTKEVKFLYKNFIDTTQTFTTSDKEIVKEVFKSLLPHPNEEQVVFQCGRRGVNKEKTWYIFNALYSKLESNKRLNG